jgi:alpha/beta superfamily hydrolase
MDNPVVVRAAEVCRDAGLATLRFNFRGVGASGGTHGGGEGEREDVLGALALLQRALGPTAPLGVIGYSFGAWVGGRVACSDDRVKGVALIAPPLAAYDFGFLRGCRKTLLLLAGSQDPYCPRKEFEALAADIPGAGARVIEGADHFFFGTLYPLGEAVAAWAHALSEASPGKARRGGGAG